MHLTAWIADEPGLMPVRIQPVNLQTSSILLAAPTAATLYVQNVHVGSIALVRLEQDLCGGRAFFENVIVNCVYAPKRFPSYIRAGHADSERFFHAYRKLEGIDGIQAESIWTEKWQVIADLLRSNLQHQVFDKHLLNLGAQIRLRHKRAAILP